MGLTPTITSGVSGASSTGTNSLSELGEDYTRFLTLLTAQIQYQDPLAPMDSTQFVSQLAQLSQVEQAVQSNTNLQSLSAQMTSLLSVSGSNILGTEVTVSSNNVHLQDGEIDSYYSVAEGATSVTATIRDEEGNVVRTIEDLSTATTGLQPVEWDGLDDNGDAVDEDGSYTLEISARDADDAPVTSFTYRKALVTEILFTEGQNYFRLAGDETVPAEAILAASVVPEADEITSES